MTPIRPRKEWTTPMAKATVTPITSTPTDDTPLPAKLTKAIDSLRVTFRDFTDDFAALNLNREVLAPKFMKVFGQWQATTGGTFVDFVRILVPSVPADREGYRAHPAYASADYLRRITQQESRETETPVARANRIASAPVNPRVALARMLASILPLLSPETLPVLWQSAADTLHWSEATIKEMQTLVESAPPLVTLRTPRGVHVDHALRVTPAPDVETSDAIAKTA